MVLRSENSSQNETVTQALVTQTIVTQPLTTQPTIMQPVIFEVAMTQPHYSQITDGARVTIGVLSSTQT